MDITVALIALLGALIGGSVTAFAQHIFNYKGQIKEKEHNLKEVRYKAIILFMYAKVNSKAFSFLKPSRPDIRTHEDLDSELKAEVFNLILFAGDSVVIACQKFIDTPSKENFLNAAIEMRKDLWGKKTSLDLTKIPHAEKLLS